MIVFYLHYDNMLNKGAVRRFCHPFRDLAEGGQAMVTYSDLFTFVIMICAIITLVRDNKRKKITVHSPAKRLDGYSVT